jgi:hypothetical protein
LFEEPTIDAALARSEQQLRPAIVRLQEAGRRPATWFVPDDALHVAAAQRRAPDVDVAPVLRRRTAQSLYW